MADALAERAPPEEAVASDDGQAQVDADAAVGVSGMEAIEAEAGQMFRYAADFVSTMWCMHGRHCFVTVLLV